MTITDDSGQVELGDHRGVIGAGAAGGDRLRLSLIEQGGVVDVDLPTAEPWLW